MTASPLSLLRSGAVQVVTREGFDLACRSRLAGSAAAAVPARSCVVDSEAIACNEQGLAVFDMILYSRHDDAVIVCAFNLLDSMEKPYTANEARKAALRSLLRPAQAGLPPLYAGRQERLRARLRTWLRWHSFEAPQAARHARPQ
jgi:ATP-dependent DNA ligase